MTQCHTDGVLRVSGNPGGLFHIRKGVVVAVDSPGAPGAEELLLRTGRISEDDWTAALREGAENHHADLVRYGGVGVAELQVVALMAARDIAFAVGRGLYPVTVEISRMLDDGILEIAPTTSRIKVSARLNSLRPRHAADQNAEDLPPPQDAGIYETEGKHIGL